MASSIVKANLFKNTTDSLAHCKLKAQKPPVGGIAVLLLEDGRWVYYLVTKTRANGKSTMESLRASLVACRNHALEHGVDAIAMPRIGCGLDRLHWDAVRPGN